MDYMWLLLTLAAGTASIVYNYLMRVVLKNSDRMAEFSWFLTASRTVVFFPIVFGLAQIDWTSYRIYTAFALAAVTYLNIYQFVRMHSVTELSVSTIIIHLKMIWVPIIAFFLIGERLAYNSYIGILMILAATIIVSPPKQLAQDKASREALLFSLTFSLMTVLQKMVSTFATTGMIVLIMSVPTAVILPLVTKNFKQNVLKTLRFDLGKKIAIVFASVSAIYLFIAAIGRGTVSDTNAIYQGMSVLGVVSGVIFLKEKNRAFHKILGGVLVLAGIVILSV